MKIMKKLIIAAALMCSAMLLTACGGGDVEYKVTVKDALGNAYGTDTIVEFYDGEEKAGMQICDENGVATKTLPSATYTIKVSSKDKKVSYSYKEVQVTGSTKAVEIVVSNTIKEEPIVLYVGGKEADAYNVVAGCTSVELGKADRNYFLFTPSVSGTYEFSVVSEVKTEIGYYGAPHFVQENNAAEMKDGKFTISITDSMIGTGNTGTTVIVLGVDADADSKDAILCVNRIGDPEKTIEDAPLTVYEKTVELSKYAFPAGKTINSFDITSKAGYTLVLNKNDGFYHLNNENGPLVVVYLTEDPTPMYIPCFKNILKKSGVNKYIFDADGTCTERIVYDNCLCEYFEYVDTKTGVYPLTEDLKTIIQERGEYVGWWDISSPGFIMKDSAGNPVAGLNSEIAWLFMCGYIE